MNGALDKSPPLRIHAKSHITCAFNGCNDLRVQKTFFEYKLRHLLRWAQYLEMGHLQRVIYKDLTYFGLYMG